MLLHDALSGGIFRRCDEVGQAVEVYDCDRHESWQQVQLLPQLNLVNSGHLQMPVEIKGYSQYSRMSQVAERDWQGGLGFCLAYNTLPLYPGHRRCCHAIVNAALSSLLDEVTQARFTHPRFILTCSDLSDSAPERKSALHAASMPAFPPNSPPRDSPPPHSTKATPLPRVFKVFIFRLIERTLKIAFVKLSKPVKPDGCP